MLVVDTDLCNGAHLAGCANLAPQEIHTGANPEAISLDPGTHTLYTANFDNTVSAFDLRHCNASDLAGCATQKPGTVTPFPLPGFEHDLWVAVDAPLHSVYVVYQKDDALVVVNTNVCNGSHRSACAALRPPTIHTGSDPESVVVDNQTQTLYTANQVDNDVSVIDASRCNAQTTAGCRHPAPAVARREMAPPPSTPPPAICVGTATGGGPMSCRSSTAPPATPRRQRAAVIPRPDRRCHRWLPFVAVAVNEA